MSVAYTFVFKFSNILSNFLIDMHLFVCCFFFSEQIPAQPSNVIICVFTLDLNRSVFVQKVAIFIKMAEHAKVFIQFIFTVSQNTSLVNV